MQKGEQSAAEAKNAWETAETGTEWESKRSELEQAVTDAKRAYDVWINDFFKSIVLGILAGIFFLAGSRFIKKLADYYQSYFAGKLQNEDKNIDCKK